MRPCFVLAVLLLLASGWAMGEDSKPVPDDFPRFIVPGHEKEMESIRRLFWLHYQHAGPLIPLWDEWMPMSTLWPARGEELAVAAPELVGERAGTRQRLRRVDHERASGFLARPPGLFRPARVRRHDRGRDAQHDPGLPDPGLGRHDHRFAHRF